MIKYICMLKKNLANIITITRIIGTIIMLFFSVTDPAFYITYIYAGLSDVIDGLIARKLNIESDFGRKLDSISDLLFYTTMMIKIWPYLVAYLPTYIWVIIWVTLTIRIALYLYVHIKHHEILASHSILNKLTGTLMFCLPFTLKNKTFFTIYSNIVAITAFIAALFEIKYLNKK